MGERSKLPLDHMRREQMRRALGKTDAPSWRDKLKAENEYESISAGTLMHETTSDVAGARWQMERDDLRREVERQKDKADAAARAGIQCEERIAALEKALREVRSKIEADDMMDLDAKLATDLRAEGIGEGE